MVTRAREIFEKIRLEGIASIDWLIQQSKYETYFLDFKRSSNHGNSASLTDNDRNNLSKAISAFANTEGGVLIWGIECKSSDKGDVAAAKYPIIKPNRFSSNIQSIASGLTIPPISAMETEEIMANEEAGFVALYIPKSDFGPHQVTGKSIYYMRAGSSSIPIPHSILSSMFGRKPSPNLIHQWIVSKATIENNGVIYSPHLLIRNRGVGTARELYINAYFVKRPGPNCQWAFNLIDKENWKGQLLFGMNLLAQTNADFRMPPDFKSQLLEIRFLLFPPFDQCLEYTICYGASESLEKRYEYSTEPAELQRIYDSCINDSSDRCISNIHKEEISPPIEGTSGFGVEN